MMSRDCDPSNVLHLNVPKAFKKEGSCLAEEIFSHEAMV